MAKKNTTTAKTADPVSTNSTSALTPTKTEAAKEGPPEKISKDKMIKRNVGGIKKKKIEKDLDQN